MINVTDAAYGATGDGSTDDTDALQAALDAAKDAGGEVVFLPPGTYSISDNIGLQNATGVTVRGAGIGTTTISDSRTKASTSYTSPLKGLITFYGGSGCGVEELTLTGTASSLDTGGSAVTGRQGTYHGGHANGFIRSVEAAAFMGEALYCDGDCPGWSVTGCYVHDTNSNGINSNCSNVQSPGALVMGNRCHNVRQSPIIVSAKSISVIGNRISNPTQTTSDIIVIDSSARAIVSGNVVHDSDCSGSGVSCLHVYGTAASSGSVLISGNIFNNVVGAFSSHWAAYAACIRINNHTGSVTVTGNVFHKVGIGDTYDHRAIMVNGSSTASVHISSNTIEKGGADTTIGVELYSDVPSDVVVFGSNSFAETTTPYKLNGQTVLMALPPTQHYGSGSPEGAVVGRSGDTYQRRDGGAGTSFYVKESGTGNTGWAAK